jgi:hypothetical protein
MRGAKGRAKAAERGVVMGNGPHADNLRNIGKMVVIRGFPGKISNDMVVSYFSDFKVVESKKGITRIEVVPLYVLLPMFQKDGP